MIFPEWLFHPGNEELRRIAVIAYTSVFIAVVSITIFSILRLLQHDYVLGFVDLSFAIVLAGIILYHRKTKKFDDYLTLFVGVTVYGMFCIYLFFFFELGKATFLWSYTFPLTVFPILGSRRGRIAVILFLIPLSLLLIVNPPLSFITSYPRGFAFPFIPSILAVSGMSYLYEKTRERNRQQLELANIALQRSNEEMEQQVQQRTAELARSEGIYRFLTERMSDMIWTTNLNMNVTYVSPSVTRILGFTPEEYRILPFHERVTPKTFDKAMAILASELEREKMPAIDPERNLQIEAEYCHKDGSTVWMESIINATRDDEGNLVGIHGVSRDITERKKMENELRLKQFTVDHAADSIAWITQDARFLDVNEAICRSLGYSREELTSMTIFDVDPDFPEEDWARLWKKMKKESSVPFETRHRRKDGSIFPVEITGSIMVADGKEYHLGIARDITQRKQEEETLRREKDFAENLIQTAQAIVLVLDTTGRIVSFNQYMEEISGYRLEEVQGKEWFSTFLPERDRNWVRELFLNATDDIQTRGNVNPIVTKDGRERIIEWHDKILKDEKDKMVGLLAIGQDITERKQAEEALRQSEEQYRSLAHTVDSIYIVDAEQRYLFMNEGHLKRFGMPLERIVGRPYSDFHSKEDSEKFAQTVKIVFETGTSIQQDHTSARDGRFFIRTFSPVVGHSGEVRAMTVVSKDITERKLAEEALRESECKILEALEFNKTILNTSSIGILTYKESGQCTYANDAVAKIVGTNVAGLLEQNFHQIQSWKKSGMYELALKALRTGTEQRIEPLVTTTFGTDIWPSLRFSSFYSEGENHLLVFMYDVTERKRAEEAIKASRHQLRALAGRLQSVREEQRKEIAREIHDELGGALTGLKIDLSRLSRSAPKSWHKTKRDSLLSKILEMTKLIDETIGKVRRLVTELRPSILDDFGLPAALEWQLQEFQKRTGIQSDFVSTVEYINMDEELSTAVFRIFQESLTNVARHANATKVTATLYKEADSLVLKVEDNGKGISEADIHNTKSVGLIGMRERALFLGGRVNFSGEPSKGTTVSVQFPFGS